jgi:transcriptional regulator with XRE-family HTH domain
MPSTGQRLRRRRERKAISLRKLAKAAGISAAYLSDIELDRRSLPDHTAAKIDAAYFRLVEARA